MEPTHTTDTTSPRIRTKITYYWSRWMKWETCESSCTKMFSKRIRRCIRGVQKFSSSNRKERIVDRSYCGGNGDEIGKVLDLKFCHFQECYRDQHMGKQRDDLCKKQFALKNFANSTVFLDVFDDCHLYCRSHYESRGFQRISLLPDGMKCLTKNSNLEGTCFQGKCTPVGCDGTIFNTFRTIINATSEYQIIKNYIGQPSTSTILAKPVLQPLLTLNKCNSCSNDGNDNDCYVTSNDIFTNIGNYEYKELLHLKPGITYAKIIKIKPYLQTFLALRTKTREIFNYDFNVAFSSEFYLNNTVINYWRRDYRNRRVKDVEYITIRGYTVEDIFIDILSYVKIDRVKVHYEIGNKITNIPVIELPFVNHNALWRTKNPNRHKLRQDHIITSDPSYKVPTTFSSTTTFSRDNITKPPKTTKMTSIEPLTTKEKIIYDGPIFQTTKKTELNKAIPLNLPLGRNLSITPCSARCGKGISIVFENDIATKYIPCNRIDCEPELLVGEWSSCSKHCGEGIIRRNISCKVITKYGSERYLPLNRCKGGNDVQSVQKCFRHCLEYRYVSNRKCDDECNRPFIQKHLQCYLLPMGVKSPMSYCRHLPRPKKSTLFTRCPCSKNVKTHFSLEKTRNMGDRCAHPIYGLHSSANKNIYSEIRQICSCSIGECERLDTLHLSSFTKTVKRRDCGSGDELLRRKIKTDRQT
ncbi:hypothetical protein SNEBB_004452 [Seison nebaliae]|nr:hypothetical protein SNEBB_004452 [Seison nebaliae]